MTDTTTFDAVEAVHTPAPAKPRRSGSLTALRLADLQGLASSMGITATAKMRKGDLIEVIQAKQSGAPSDTGRTGAPRRATRAASAPTTRANDETNPQPVTTSSAPTAPADEAKGVESGTQSVRQAAVRERPQRAQAVRPQRAQGERPQRAQGEKPTAERPVAERQQGGDRAERPAAERQQGGDRAERPVADRQQGGDRAERPVADRQQGDRPQAQAQNRFDDDDDSRPGRRRNRNRNRGREKRPSGAVGGADFENEPQVAEDDVIVPVAGILDLHDNYAFVRTSGYLPGPGDVYVPLGLAKRHGLRKGDAVTGAVRAPRDGEEAPQVQGTGRNARQKFNPLIRLDTVNGMAPDEARKRPEFGKLTPLYPQDRLRLETDATALTTRIIDLVAPIGKGQRGLIVSPPKAGKTLILQAIANAITTNNPEAHLMVVLVDERPEEVTDMQRTVKGEVIASTFDRPAEDHTTVAELAIERAKRLVEMGHDVVVLLDSITRLGRAYNLAAPASGRILSGGVDSSALYPPKRFFGAARNIENGGSLTILATALVETGSKMDEVIFEEFKGTGNMELRLSRQLADRRIFPAVDVNPSGTRREEILLAPDELKIMWKLRRVLSALDPQQGVELLLDRLRKTKSNYEFLVQVQQTSAIKLGDEDE